MIIRWLGALCIFGACSAVGFSAARSCRTKVHALEQLTRCLEVMLCQIEYRLTGLAELCDILCSACRGPVRQVFREFGLELHRGTAAGVPVAMALAVERCPELPEPCRQILTELALTLGSADPEGELRSLQYARARAGEALTELRRKQAGQLRSCRALGLCGGAALVILLL